MFVESIYFFISFIDKTYLFLCYLCILYYKVPLIKKQMRIINIITILLLNVFCYSQTPPTGKYYQNSWGNSNTRPTSLLDNETYRLKLNLTDENSFVFPCKATTKICSNYGIRSGRMHTGIDLKQNLGDSIASAWDGYVRIANEGYYGYGKLVVIRHNNGLETFYAHLSKILVKENEKVTAGDIIGLAGRTGRATTEHLHFEVRFLYEHFNPNTIIDFDNQILKADSLIVQNKKFSAKLSSEENTSFEILVEENTFNTLQDSNVSTTVISNNEDISTENKDLINNNITKTQKNVSSDVHIIVKGDTLYKLSKRYGVSIKELCRINNIKETSILSLGQKIKLK